MPFRLNSMRKTLALLVVPLAAAALAGGCGGSSSDTTTEALSATDWANSLCTSISTWSSSVQSAGQGLTSGDVGSLQSATSDLKEATTTFVDEVKALGPPNTENGQQAKESLNTLTDSLSSGVDKIKQTADGVSGAGGLLAAVSSIGTTVQKMGTEAQTAFNNLQTGELKDALNNAPECKKLQGRS